MRHVQLKENSTKSVQMSQHLFKRIIMEPIRYFMKRRISKKKKKKKKNQLKKRKKEKKKRIKKGRCVGEEKK